MQRLITEGRVVRHRAALGDGRRRKALWVVHRADCEFAVGCPPLVDLAAEFGEHGVLARVQCGLIARCKTCRPDLLGPRS